MAIVRPVRLALAADAREHRRTACPDLWISPTKLLIVPLVLGAIPWMVYA